MDGLPGPYAQPTVPTALYDLENDIGETTDVSDFHPDVVRRLDEIAEVARATLGDRLTQREGAEVRPPGRKSLGRADAVAHLAVGATVLSTTALDPRYSGGGVGVLTDGRLGSGDFRDGLWLGFDGVDFEATLDLGAQTRISRLGLDCLEVQSARILFPREVTFAVSDDGVSWRDLPPVVIPAEPRAAVEARRVSVDAAITARYVRVVAANHEPLPEWHVGAGGTGWVFVDEIVIQ